MLKLAKVIQEVRMRVRSEKAASHDATSRSFRRPLGAARNT